MGGHGGSIDARRMFRPTLSGLAFVTRLHRRTAWAKAE